jgi:hypothetical protein
LRNHPGVPSLSSGRQERRQNRRCSSQDSRRFGCLGYSLRRIHTCVNDGPVLVTDGACACSARSRCGDCGRPMQDSVGGSAGRRTACAPR